MDKKYINSCFFLSRFTVWYGVHFFAYIEKNVYLCSVDI